MPNQSAEAKERSRAYHRAYYQANKERIKSNVRTYAATHKSEIAVKSKAYREVNKAKLTAKSRAYYEAHREERIAYQKALHASKADAVKAYKKIWWQKNKDKCAAERQANRHHIRRVSKEWYERNYASYRDRYVANALKRRALKSTTVVERINYKKILLDSGGLCGICRRPLDLFGTDFDHIVPLSRGGTHTMNNIQATHAFCNRSKGAKVG